MLSADKNSPITFIKWLKKNKTVLYAIDQDYGLKNSSNVDFLALKQLLQMLLSKL